MQARGLDTGGGQGRAQLAHELGHDDAVGFEAVAQRVGVELGRFDRGRGGLRVARLEVGPRAQQLGFDDEHAPHEVVDLARAGARRRPERPERAHSSCPKSKKTVSPSPCRRMSKR